MAPASRLATLTGYKPLNELKALLADGEGHPCVVDVASKAAHVNAAINRAIDGGGGFYDAFMVAASNRGEWPTKIEQDLNFLRRALNIHDTCSGYEVAAHTVKVIDAIGVVYDGMPAFRLAFESAYTDIEVRETVHLLTQLKLAGLGLDAKLIEKFSEKGILDLFDLLLKGTVDGKICLPFEAETLKGKLIALGYIDSEWNWVIHDDLKSDTFEVMAYKF
ncbi:hypothetical protein HOD30_02005 [Candidatus Peregrinibacteria bacterium]|jgi:hypothetical protein|nr:hypothetical protein [Candidatus Peregrinibacteria bacterium]MBT4631811.1 hypothetical protein [Candidatus Peregrinibacteria bacterium]MBT5517303.1 hypothetical protein [Candidatus Peregrinibacteria bacterium]MBT5824464.1 hypothetical protein [Candidatus Peregrinibacteria bacterium]